MFKIVGQKITSCAFVMRRVQSVHTTNSERTLGNFFTILKKFLVNLYAPSLTYLQIKDIVPCDVRYDACKKLQSESL